MKQPHEDERIYILSEEKPARAVIHFGVPLIAGMFVMVLYNLTDTYFIGLMRDDYQLAAVNLAYPIMMVTIALSNIVGTGASSLIARSIGAGDNDKAEHTLTSGWVLTLINSAVIAGLGLLLLDPLVRLLGAGNHTFLYTKQYAAILLSGSFFTMANYTFGQLLRSEGSVRYSIAGMIIGTAFNIVFDPIFIFTLHLGIRGAAAATVLGNLAGALVSVYFYMAGKTLLKPGLKYLKPTGEILREIFKIGIPSSLETLLTSGAYVVNNNLAASYGELTVAAMGVAQKLLSLGSYIYQGYAAGIQPLMGYNCGAGNYKRMRDILKSGILVSSGTELAVMAVYGIFAPQLIALFTDSNEVIAIGTKVLRTLIWILPFVGAVSMSRTTFQAMGKPKYAFGITLIRQLFLYVPLLLVLNRIFGFNGMIWAQPLTELIMMIASVTLLLNVLKASEEHPVI